MNDGIDTMRDNNDIAPFKNILNEMYSKDISKKVHSSYLLKAQQGQFTGCVAPFGYRKDPEDEKTTCWWTRKPPPLSGKSSFGRWKDTAPTTSGAGWKNRRCLALHGGTGNGASAMSAPNGKRKTPENGRYMWDFSVIKDILMNPVYTGAIASQKKDYRFKIGTIGEKKPQDWIVVEERHEPLIDSKSFAIVQDKLKSRQRPRQDGETSLFAGLSSAASAQVADHPHHPRQAPAADLRL